MARQGFGHDLILLAERAECTIEIGRAQRDGGGDQRQPIGVILLDFYAAINASDRVGRRFNGGCHEGTRNVDDLLRCFGIADPLPWNLYKHDARTVLRSLFARTAERINPAGLIAAASDLHLASAATYNPSGYYEASEAAAIIGVGRASMPPARVRPRRRSVMRQSPSAPVREPFSQSLVRGVACSRETPGIPCRDRGGPW